MRFHTSAPCMGAVRGHRLWPAVAMARAGVGGRPTASAPWGYLIHENAPSPLATRSPTATPGAYPGGHRGVVLIPSDFVCPDGSRVARSARPQFIDLGRCMAAGVAAAVTATVAVLMPPTAGGIRVGGSGSVGAAAGLPVPPGPAHGVTKT